MTAATQAPPADAAGLDLAVESQEDRTHRIVRATVGDDHFRHGLRRARDGAAGWDGVEATEGKAVIELAVIKTSKGHALDALRVRSGADAVIYLGDDVTDEKAFAHLGAGDVSIKVGDGPTIARHRIPDTDTVATVLQFLLTQRSHIVIADNRRDQTS